MALDERKKQVLNAIVDDYVSTYEPVGSKTLIERHNFTVSSATLRNEMAELERLGLIEKPHTSAGRIPSDKGYREYVDSLMTFDDLSAQEREDISKRIDSSINDITDLIKNATDTLSERTGFVSLYMSPRLHKSFLKQLKMLMIEPGKALVVIVLSAGVVKDKVVRIPNFLTGEQIMQISNSVEQKLTGKPPAEITLVTVASSTTAAGMTARPTGTARAGRRGTPSATRRSTGSVPCPPRSWPETITAAVSERAWEKRTEIN